MQESIKITLFQELPYVDFIRFTAYCIPYPEGGMYKTGINNEKVFQLHPSHLRGAKLIFERLNISPKIEINGVTDHEQNIKTGTKERMPIVLKITENGILVNDSKHMQDHWVPNNNLDIAWAILKEAGVITPRSMWAKLAEDHKMFVELDEISAIIRGLTYIDPVKKARYITALKEYRASAFEGKRVKKEGDAQVINYYDSYWYPILVFKKLGLVIQEGTKELQLTEEGKEKSSWRTK